MSCLPPLLAGVYRHYKGQHYLVLGYGRLSDGRDEGQEVVVYVGLELDGAKPGARIQVRSAAGFHDVSAGVPRFTYAGSTWEGS